MQLIDADALRETIESKIYWSAIYDGLDMLQTIDEAPIVDAVEVVHGRWVEDSVQSRDSFPLRIYECSECGGIAYRHKFNYCPNCGADMRGDGDG